MELSIAENIRVLRKQRKMTQEKLAEALGVTVGAVHKWEAGLSVPELEMIVRLADFFDTSVDVLLGYRVRDDRTEAILERLNEYCRTMDPGALDEAERALGKYPNSFRIVCECAAVYLAFGTGLDAPAHLRRAVELLERARALLPQSDDPAISETMIIASMSTAWFLLGQREKCIDLLRRHNAGGFFSSQIGFMLAAYMHGEEEAMPFLSEGMVNGLSDILTAMMGSFFVYRARRDWDEALRISEWAVTVLEGMKKDEGGGFIDKTHAQILAALAYARLRTGQPEAARDALRSAAALALAFDAAPDYSARTIRFAEFTEHSVMIHILGAGACRGVARLLGMLEAPELSEQWKEITGYDGSDAES